ncbi:MAG: AIR synthase-related protein, partial [Patescibacteria group bacterium]|nr:AIR synthase-related protein [Patescibacteria group bacterium]
AGLLHAVTDCGAGGLSSAIGEMGQTIGARVELSQVPLKYSGLAPWEIWISEAQERMVIAVAPDNVPAVLGICLLHNVEATVLGKFTGDKKLVVTFNGQVVCDLTMEFLHRGLPQRVMVGTYTQPTYAVPVVPQPSDATAWAHLYRKVMAHPNICSKEPIVRQYDHTVQGTGALPSYGGVRHDGPNDAVVLAPIPGKPYGLVIGHGLHPALNRLDPYRGSLWAAAEAIANCVAVGGDPATIGLIDNFIWPKPKDEWLGRLDAAVDACVDVMHAFERPFVSGKDSLSGTYRGPTGEIHIPPVLCISAFGRIPDVSRTVTADFKRENSYIVLVGHLNPNAMGGSVYLDVLGGLPAAPVPNVPLDELPGRFRQLHNAIVSSGILAAHDISEGGVAVTLAEMCFGGNCGATVDLAALGEGRPDLLFFNEMAGCFLVEIAPSRHPASVLGSLPYSILGRTTSWPVIRLVTGESQLCEIRTDDLKAAWQRPLQEVFP